MITPLLPWLIFILLAVAVIGEEISIDELLSLGNHALASDEFDTAIDLYQRGLRVSLLRHDQVNSLSTVISLHTNLATAYSALEENERAAESYQNALLAYKTTIDAIKDHSMHQEVTLIAAQAAFFLGMVNQDIGKPRDAVDAYTYANSLDPLHWASLANLGAVFHDDLINHRKIPQN